MASPADDPLPPGTASAFARLRAGFRRGLAARWAEIDAATDASQRQQALHRLAGAAGGFGYLQLGQAAREAEIALHDVDAAACRRALDALQRLIERIQHVEDGHDTVL